MYALIKMRYRLKKITARQVWEYADRGEITAQQAAAICGPRPKDSNG